MLRKGKKVAVALVGSTLYSDEGSFKIKKSKIRGEVSEGMLCAEDELGLGDDHDGIIVLDSKAKVGSALSNYYAVETDTIFEIGLTPNRIDAASHFGVARDLVAYFNMSENVTLNQIDTSKFLNPSTDSPIEVKVFDEQACPRYTGISIDGVQVKPSPDWLKNRLIRIGLKPINNIVDISNYVMHEMGQPLHAFDAQFISDSEIHVKTLKEGTVFKTLDGVDRKLSHEDLMICSKDEPLCLAGVFGGLDSGVSESTTRIFLESANFDAVQIRKSAKRHGLNTDSSFRFERGADPTACDTALKRASQLILELAGGQLSGAMIDHYPIEKEANLIEFSFKNLDRLIGHTIKKSIVEKILVSLDFKILSKNNETLRLESPIYRVDVTREVDVIEEVLRIYGFNRIPMPSRLRANINPIDQLSRLELERKLSEYLSSNGFTEILNNSLSRPSLYQEDLDLVKMLNPLSSELAVLRSQLMHGGLSVIAHNIHRSRKNQKLFESGKTYGTSADGNYIEEYKLGIWTTGDSLDENWEGKKEATRLNELRKLVENCLQRLKVAKWKLKEMKPNHYFETGVEFFMGDSVIAKLGYINQKTLEEADIKQEVLYAEINWTALFQKLKLKSFQAKPLIKFPVVRRDLALLLKDDVKFDAITRMAKQVLGQRMIDIDLFDVYEGEKLPKGNKSYGVAFFFQDKEKTLTDKIVDQMMNRMIDSLQKELGATLR